MIYGSVVFVAIPKILYNDELPVEKISVKFLGMIVIISLASVTVYMYTNWAGHKYVRSRLAKTGQESLLNNLKEGVYLFNESDSTMLFMNVAAKRINDRLMSRVSKTWLIDENNILDRRGVYFEKIDQKALKSSNFKQAIELLEKTRETVSMN